VITTRRELAVLLASPEVRAVLAMGPGASPEYLADAILAARNGRGDPPVGERWDAVEVSLVTELGVRPPGHVGRSPVLSLEAWEYVTDLALEALAARRGAGAA
jgi:hypothetical protein